MRANFLRNAFDWKFFVRAAVFLLFVRLLFHTFTLITFLRSTHSRPENKTKTGNMEFYEQLVETISRDDPQAIGRISVQNLNILLSQSPPGFCFPPLHIAVSCYLYPVMHKYTILQASKGATKCLKYLLKHVPEINVNLRHTMCEWHPLTTPFFTALHGLFVPGQDAIDKQVC